LFIASKNPHKIAEMKVILSGTGLVIKSMNDVVGLPDVPETGSTLQENAVLKALAVYEYTGLPSVADDTGLEVDALQGEPGVYSARYAGPDASYSDNLNKLLVELKKQKAGNRKARFRTVIALKTSRDLQIFHGVCEGEILKSGRGSNGFGYDPVFIPDGYKESFGEMEESLKNRISHRALALKKLNEFILTHADYLSR
jgi:XTP/dITP diphosphohydrolase